MALHFDALVLLEVRSDGQLSCSLTTFPESEWTLKIRVSIVGGGSVKSIAMIGWDKGTCQGVIALGRKVFSASYKVALATQVRLLR